MALYYVDTCIWLNLFKKEKRFWNLAFKFIILKKDFIIFSGIMLKELEYIINDKIVFNEKLFYIKENFKFIKVTFKDYELARIYEKENNFLISFYDFLHIAICKNNSFVLVTRDNDMIKIGKKYISIKKPEELH